jgi:hypothetical protein
MLELGDIGFSTCNGSLFSQTIRWFTNYPYSHSFIISDQDNVDNPKDRYAYVLEADKAAVNYTRFGKYNVSDTSYAIYRPLDSLKISSGIIEALEKTTRAFLYKDYSYCRVAGIGLTIALARIGIQISNPIRMGTICSEVTWYYLSQLMPGIFGDLDHTVVSNRDLHHLMIHSGKFKLIKEKAFNGEVRDYD